MPKVGDWYRYFRITPDWKRRERGWRVFTLAFFRWREIPKEGDSIQRRHYRGVFIHFMFWLPFDAD